MLADTRTLAKLEKIEQRCDALRFEKVADVAVEMCQTKEHFRQEPPAASGLSWSEAPAGAAWGGSWITAWFRGDARLPQRCAGRKVFVRAKTGGETLFVVDGEHRGVFDGNHPVVMMTLNGVADQEYHLAFEAYSGHSYPGTQPHDTGVAVAEGSKTFEGVELLVEREDVAAFVFDLRVLRGLMSCLDANSLRRNKIAVTLMEVYALLDAMPQETPETSWRPKLAAAREVMRPLLELRNGPTTPAVSLVGHSHIDTAWLWTLDETWRKCARTFSSVLNLMEQYPEFIFMQTAPCHAEWMRREYPGIFRRMQKMASEGRWEPNGAMWVEPDCNIPSGESFVRQLLVGQQTTREMFDYTADTLWLPDVFGYSAALPQILRGCGVEFFCTSKIAWNDTTRFPYDTFTWRGIDGSDVTAHYTVIQGWPDPQELTGQWNWIQHKDVQDRRLFPIGYGDGGGGPMAEMLQVARRVTDLEGCPRAEFTTVGGFMKRLRDELPPLPEWVGELYLECHRGTLTSVAPIKRGNRKAEMALRDAELWAASATVAGQEYPAQRFRGLWESLLTNQFHDILPGSSIAEVNDEAIGAFDECVGQARGISLGALKAIGGGDAHDAPNALLVSNSLSWDRDGEIALADPGADLWPSAPSVTLQKVTDASGERLAVINGLRVPAMGVATLELGGRALSDETEGPFVVTEDRVQTPFAGLSFDETGRIVSFVDKRSGRELVKPGGALNSLLMGEDIPLMYDNWEIDTDQEVKLEPQRRLVRREVIAQGPLQLRILVEYELGDASRLVQHIVLHSTSPQVDFDTVVDWHDKHKLLKVGFELDVLAETARHEIQYGHVERPTHRNLPQDRARFEVCAHKWTDLS